MQIENLNLDDFGIFARSRLSDLDDGLTVISGPQRAGKTTFMQAVRRLGYGISTGDDLPPAASQYDITADIVADGHRYELSLDGYASPTLTPLNGGPEREIRDIYGGLRESQYQQLYTISLDELRRTPRDLDSEESLSEILLGAYGDIHDIPDIRDEFERQAESIGGKHGRAVYDLKDPIDKIQEGVDERDTALKQVKEYEQTTCERERVEDEIQEIDSNISTLDTEKGQLDAIHTTYVDYTELRELEDELENTETAAINSFPLEHINRAKNLNNQYEPATDDLDRAEDEFNTAVSADDPDTYRQNLLDSRATVETYLKEIRGWETRIDSIQDRLDESKEQKKQLQRRVSTLHPEWENLDHVRSQEEDVFSQERVRDTVKSYQNISETVDELESNIDELERRENDLGERIDQAVEASDHDSGQSHFSTVIVGLAFALIAGVGAGILAGPIAGVLVTTLIFVATGAYVNSQLETTKPSHDGMSVENLRAEYEKVEAELDAREGTLEKRQEDLAETKKDLEAIKDAYDLPEDSTPKSVKQFHERLLALQDDIEACDIRVNELQSDVTEVRNQIDAAATFLVDLGVLDSEADDPIEDAQSVFTAVERAANHLELALTVAEKEETATRLEDEIVDLLTLWDEVEDPSKDDRGDILPALDAFLERGKEIQAVEDAEKRRNSLQNRILNHLTKSAVEDKLELYRDPEDGDDWHLNAYKRILDKYGDIETIKKRLEDINERREELENKRESKVEERIELEREMESLASDDDVRAAHATIESGQKGLEPLAEEYAELRIAEYFLDELHEQFIDRTTGPLLDEATKIFERITDSTYVSVDSQTAFENLDFETTLADGSTQSSGELSRATAEQLFLSVRLARIKLHNEPLPVLLDDSLTNFDPAHINRTLSAIDELAGETQVFLLTCHPTLLEQVEMNADVENYWSLEDGKFDGPYRSPSQPCNLLKSTSPTMKRDD